jgi:hypothetical protein
VALLTDPWVMSAREGGAVAAEVGGWGVNEVLG